MKKFHHLILIKALLFTTLACTKDFESINTNQNAPNEVHPRLLLRQVIFDYGEQMSYEGFVAGNLLGQYFSAIDFNLFDRHSLLEPQFGGNPWDILYINLRDNEIMLQSAGKNPAFAVYEGPANILKAYMAGTLTDLFGDVPYFEALQGKNGVITPVYDDQEQIYLSPGGILDLLENGVNLVENYVGNTPLEGDLLFNGDLDAWAKFGRSLQIKYLMRISDVENVGSQLQEIYQSGNYIRETTQNATFDFTTTPPNNFRMSTARVGDYNLYLMSETIENILKAYNDPRINVYFRPTATDPNVFKGIRNGPDASQLSITVGDFSLSGAIFREGADALDANFMTSFETNLLLAEAAVKGLIDADPKALYELGVQQAFEYWQTEMPTDYLTNGSAAYGFDGKTPLEQIITQRWLANIGNGYEGWIDFRRTGIPTFLPVTASLNNGLIPVRFPYPTSEAALNSGNFESVTNGPEGNSPNIRVWWDVK